MSSNYSSKRIVRNTVMLYIRTGVMMLITFYTTRVLLHQLGVEDYGIFDVMMGVVTLFSFAGQSLTTATQRFVSSALGEGDEEKVTRAFSASIYLYIVMVLVSILLFETVGLWYVNNYINVPPNRLFAAKIVYQLVILQFVFLTFRIPYSAAVIAYERMDFYAYVSIVEAVLALGLIYILSISNTDKLILYVFLLVITRFLVFLSYVIYCRKYTPNCKVVDMYSIPKNAFQEIWAFSGWNIFGSFANTTNHYGTNLIVNYFCGVTVNATIGIANQLTMGLYNLVGNMQTAFNPQVIKLYAAKDFKTFKELLYRNSKFCFFLYLLLLVPFYICISDILLLWLGRIPIYSVELCRCMLLYLAIESLSYPLSVAVQADGNIKRYQQVTGLLFLAMLPVAYLMLGTGYGIVSVFIARICQNVFLTVYRLKYLHQIMAFNVKQFGLKVINVCIVVMGLSFGLPFAVYSMIDEGWLRVIIVIAFSLACTASSIFFVGLTRAERMTLIGIVQNRIKKYNS